MAKHSIRLWATPLTVGAFALSAVSGILIFFHLNVGLIKVVHQWLSWIFVFGALVHLVDNRAALVQHLRRPIGRSIVAGFTILIILSLLPFGNGRPTMPPERLNMIMLHTPLDAMAKVANHHPEILLEELRSQGLHVSGTEQTIGDIAKTNGRTSSEILSAIF